MTDVKNKCGSKGCSISEVDKRTGYDEDSRRLFQDAVQVTDNKEKEHEGY